MLRLTLFSGVLLAAGCATTPAPIPAGPAAADADSPEGQVHEPSRALGDSPVWQPPSGPREGVVFACPHHPEVVSEVPGVCPKCHMDLLPTEQEEVGATTAEAHPGHGGAVTLYACPHHPEATSDQPGTCPKCGGMALVPQKPAAADAASKVTYACPHHPEVTSDAPGTCAKCGGMALVPQKPAAADAASDAASKVTYVCPHHPEVTSDRPGTCPKCGGMALVPVKQETQP